MEPEITKCTLKLNMLQLAKTATTSKPDVTNKNKQNSHVLKITIQALKLKH